MNSQKFLKFIKNLYMYKWHDSLLFLQAIAEDSQLEILLTERIALFFALSIILITFSLCMASTISWLRCWNISNRLQVKITADSLQLRLCCLRALYKKTKCPHRESDIVSEFGLNNIESATISA